MKDFLQFINNRKEQTTIDKMFNESYKTNNMNKFCGDLTGIFKSEFTDKKVLCVGSEFPFKTEIRFFNKAWSEVFLLVFKS